MIRKIGIFGVLIAIFGIFMSSFGAPAPIVSASGAPKLEITGVNFSLSGPEMDQETGEMSFATVNYSGTIGFQSNFAPASVRIKDDSGRWFDSTPYFLYNQETGLYSGTLSWFPWYRETDWGMQKLTVETHMLEVSPFYETDKGFATTEAKMGVWALVASDNLMFGVMITPAWTAPQFEHEVGMLKFECSSGESLEEGLFTPNQWSSGFTEDWEHIFNYPVPAGGPGTLYFGTHDLGAQGSWVSVYNQKLPGCGSEVYLPMVVR